MSRIRAVDKRIDDNLPNLSDLDFQNFFPLTPDDLCFIRNVILNIKSRLSYAFQDISSEFLDFSKVRSGIFRIVGFLDRQWFSFTKQVPSRIIQSVIFSQQPQFIQSFSGIPVNIPILPFSFAFLIRSNNRSSSTSSTPYFVSVSSHPEYVSSLFSKKFCS